jgi:predicted dehydrogenase
MTTRTTTPVRVGLIGTGWWAEPMYLPALKEHPYGRITALVGRNASPLAEEWGIAHVYDDYRQMIADRAVDAVIIATRNDTHYPITMAALEAGLHVLCEKPLGLNYPEAAAMAARATAQGVKHMTPFTYSYMPTARYLKQLIDSGYIGQPYHLNLRYFTGYAHTPHTYNWRLDRALAGSGALGDIGSHFLYLAYWLFGGITEVCAELGEVVERAQLDPNGQPYTRTDDNAMLLLKFASGAQGMIHASNIASEETKFGQIHGLDFHGSDGTLHCAIDWEQTQEIRGMRVGGGPAKVLPIPDAIWGSVRRERVHDTYRDLFRTQEFMTRQWVTAIALDQPVTPDFHAGAYVQRVMDAALVSHANRCWVKVESIAA